VLLKTRNKLIQRLGVVRKRRAAPAVHTSQIGAATQTNLDIATFDPAEP
jgi:hypothetical protein